MKTLFLSIIAITSVAGVNAQFSTTLHFGYSTQSKNLFAVTGFNVSYRHILYSDYDKTIERKILPMVEIGELGHIDYNADHVIYGHISAGAMYKQFIALKAGFVYGGNQVKQDRHVYEDTTIILTKGNNSSNFTGIQLAISQSVDLLQNRDGKGVLQLFAQQTYLHKFSQYTKNIFFCTVGVRLIYNKKN